MKSVDEKIDELAQATAIGFAEIQAEFREEIAELRTGLRSDVQKDMRDLFTFFFERYLGPLQNDHDALAGRVEKLEEHVYA